MSLTGGKRKVNKGLKDWVTFVKKVQNEESLTYKDAIHRAKQRKDKGEKWMTGGESTHMEVNEKPVTNVSYDMEEREPTMSAMENEDANIKGGRRGRRTMRRNMGRNMRRNMSSSIGGGRGRGSSKSRGRGRTVRRARGRASRRH